MTELVWLRAFSSNADRHPGASFDDVEARRAQRRCDSSTATHKHRGAIAAVVELHRDLATPETRPQQLDPVVGVNHRRTRQDACGDALRLQRDRARLDRQPRTRAEPEGVWTRDVRAVDDELRRSSVADDAATVSPMGFVIRRQVGSFTTA